MQHDPLEFVQYTDMYGKPIKYVIEEDRISSVDFYDDGTPFLATFVTRLRGFEDGIRIAINRDFGEGSAKAEKKRELLKINKMLEKNTSDMIQLQWLESKDRRIEDLEEEIRSLNSTGYRLSIIIEDAKEDGLVPDEAVVMREEKIREKISKLRNEVKVLKEKKKETYTLPYEKLTKIEAALKRDKDMIKTNFKGFTNVCKIIFGDRGDRQIKNTKTFYTSFTVGADGEPYGQKFVGRGLEGFWEHPAEVRNLASYARQNGFESFSMEFSARKISKRELERMRQKEREAEQDRKDFMESTREVTFLTTTLRF